MIVGEWGLTGGSGCGSVAVLEYTHAHPPPHFREESAEVLCFESLGNPRS